MQYLYFISQAYTSFLITPRRRQIYHRYLLEVRFATDTSYQYLLLEVKNVWITCITRSKRYYRLLLNVRNTTLSLEVRVAIGYQSKLEMPQVITRSQSCHRLSFEVRDVTSYYQRLEMPQFILEVRDDIGSYKK